MAGSLSRVINCLQQRKTLIRDYITTVRNLYSSGHDSGEIRSPNRWVKVMAMLVWLLARWCPFCILTLLSKFNISSQFLYLKALARYSVASPSSFTSSLGIFSCGRCSDLILTEKYIGIISELHEAKSYDLCRCAPSFPFLAICERHFYSLSFRTKFASTSLNLVVIPDIEFAVLLDEPPANIGTMSHQNMSCCSIFGMLPKLIPAFSVFWTFEFKWTGPSLNRRAQLMTSNRVAY